jgi:hypothetical protein
MKSLCRRPTEDEKVKEAADAAAAAEAVEAAKLTRQKCPRRNSADAAVENHVDTGCDVAPLKLPDIQAK